MYKKLHKNNLTVVTATWYPHFSKEGSSDRLRGTLALQTLTYLLNLGYKFILVDGGSDAAFLAELKKIGVIPHMQKNAGMSRGRQEGFALAFNDPATLAVLWIEPEKVSIVRDGCIPTMIDAMDEHTALVLPHRSAKSFLTLPPLQAATERMANDLCTQIICSAGWWPWEDMMLDWFFGTRLFRREVLEFFLQEHTQVKDTKEGVKLLPEMWSDALFFPILYVLFHQMGVKSVEIEYCHPPEQTIFETGNGIFDRKRILQSHCIVRGIFELTRRLQGKESCLALAL